MRYILISSVIGCAITTSVLAQGLFPQSTVNADSAQLARGRSAYTVECQNCHGVTLEGTQFGPPLKGAQFETKWRNSSRAAFSERIRTTMPPGKLGSLGTETLTDIEAYILQGNVRGAGTVVMAAAPRATVPARPTNEGASMMGASERRDNDPQYKAAMQAKQARLDSLAPVTDSALSAPGAGDWMMWRRTYEGQGYSPLKQINRSNVRNLTASWSLVLPASSNQLTPLVYDGVMFIASGPGVYALNAATGDVLWQYSRPGGGGIGGAGAAHGRSLAIYENKLFAATADGQLAALDFKTGKVIWTQPIASAAAGAGYSLSGGPLVAKGVVMIGVSLGVSNAGGCYILGLDAATGKERWRFHTIARPGEPGGDTWNGAPVEERFGAGVWTVGSYDPQLDLAYFGIGNTYSTATLLEPRPGAAGVTANEALYTDSTVALRPETGELVWHYQHHQRDVWDLDWVFEQSIVTLPVAGRPRKLVVTGGKIAIFDALDAATGEFVFAKDMGLQNVISAIDPKTGEKTVNPALQPEAGMKKLMCPNSIGARNWTATALNPESGVLFVPMLENCADYTYNPRSAAQTAKGGIDIGFAARAPLNHDGNFGRLAAFDLKSGNMLWVRRQRVPYVSAALATGGELVFAGDVDRNFVAYDQRSGKVLWSTRLAASAESYPVSYSANGRQFIAVIAGGGSPWGSSSRGFVPEVTAPPAGISVVTFELPR